MSQWAENGYGLFSVASALIVFTLHEMGHYIAAGLCGVNVESVIIGIGREVWSRRGRNGTLWSIRLLPVCGRIHLTPRSTEEAATGPRRGLFNDQSWRRRFAIVAAGPSMNFLLGFTVLAIFFAAIGIPATPTIITGIEHGSPAYAAGIRSGDEFIAVGGHPARRFEDISRAAETATAPLRLTLLRDRQRIDTTVMPRAIIYRDAMGLMHSHRTIGVIVLTRPLRLTAFTAVNGVPTHRDANTAELLLTPQLGRDAQISLLAIDQNVHDYDIHLPPPSLQPIVTEDGGRAIYLGPFHDNFFLPLDPLAAWKEAGRESARLVTGLVGAIGNLGPIDLGTIEAQTTVLRRTAPWRASLFKLMYNTAGLSFCIGLINLLPLPFFDGGFLLAIALEGAAGKERAAVLHPFVMRIVFLMVVMLWLLSNGPMLAKFMQP